MKRIIFMLVALMMFVSCTETNSKVDTEVYEVSDFINLKCVASDSYSRIYVDTNTGVLYHYKVSKYSNSYIPIYNADGTLKNINQYDQDKLQKK
jgi:hypothetical protein